MQAVMLFLTVMAVVGSRAKNSSSPISRFALIFAGVALAAALASRRVV
jgi:hypothetical protein